MNQNLINQNMDYLYKLQKDETTHQSNRLMWMLSAHALLFAGLCAISFRGLHDVVLLVCLLMGVLLGLSAIYSLGISELSIGHVYEIWDEYDNLDDAQKTSPIPHRFSLAPSFVLNSNWRFLMFYKFAPNVFLTGWIILLVSCIEKYLNLINLSNIQVDKYFIVIILFLGVLLVVCMFTNIYREVLLGRLREERKRESRKRKKQDKKNSFMSFSFSCVKNDSFHCNSKAMYEGFASMSIYHIMIDRFCGNWTTNPIIGEDGFYGGHIKGIISKLDYIKSLGHNAIMLTPVFETKHYHGYHVVDFEKIDPHFGTWENLQVLIREAHKKEIKIICDFVPNHCHIDNGYFQLARNDNNSPYRNWFYFNEGRHGGFVSYQNYPALPKINLFNEAASDYLISVASRMVKMGIDGLRIDHIIGVPFDFVRHLSQNLKGINPNIFIIGEAWLDNPRDLSQIEYINNTRRTEAHRRECIQEQIQLDYCGIIDGILDFSFRELIISEVRLGHRILGNTHLKERLDVHFFQYHKGFVPFLFIDNHDTNRFLYYCNYDTSLLREAISLMRSYPYPMIIYYGTEDGMYNDDDINGRSNGDDDVRGPKIWR